MLEPDYTDPEVVKRWLREQVAKQETSILVTVFAARCALRVIPILSRDVQTDRGVSLTLVHRSLRMAAVSWASGRFPASEVTRVVEQSAIDGVVQQAFSSAATFAARSALAAYGSILNDTSEPQIAASIAANTAYWTAVSAGKFAAAPAAEDVRLLDTRLPAFLLAQRKLWHEDMPDQIGALWTEMQSVLRDADEDWDVWLEWYYARLRGGLTYPNLSADANKRIELARVTGEYRGEQRISEADWQTPAIVNRKIKEIIEEETEKDKLNQFISDYPPPPVHVGELVLRIVDNAAAPVTVGEVAEAVNNVTGGTPRSSVNWYLSKFYRESRIQRIKRGVYAPNSFTPDAEETEETAPKKPEQGAGPKFRLFNGQVDVGLSPPSDQEASDRTQIDLHERLKRKTGLLRKSLGNQLARYPILADAMEDYCKALDCANIVDLDINNIWMSGTGLISQARAFAALNPAKQITEPLEPEQQGLLGECARLHGAFVMGFEAGRELAERSQIPLLSNEELNALLENERAIVRWLLRSDQFELSDRARELFEHIDRMLVVTGEGAEDVAYGAYPAIRNILILATQIVEKTDRIAGRLSYLGAPTQAIIVGAISLLTQNAAVVLGISNSVPELRLYVEWLLQRLEERYREDENMS